jgi:hypothetical protein
MKSKSRQVTVSSSNYPHKKGVLPKKGDEKLNRSLANRVFGMDLTQVNVNQAQCLPVKSP